MGSGCSTAEEPTLELVGSIPVWCFTFSLSFHPSAMCTSSLIRSLEEVQHYYFWFFLTRKWMLSWAAWGKANTVFTELAKNWDLMSLFCYVCQFEQRRCPHLLFILVKYQKWLPNFSECSWPWITPVLAWLSQQITQVAQLSLLISLK